MRIALVSLSQHWLDKNANIQHCRQFIQESKKQGCDLVIFPEMTLTGYSLDVNSFTENLSDSWSLNTFHQLAKAIDINIIFGASLSYPGHSPQNCLCLATPSVVSAVYSKLHPFTFVGEEKVFLAGNSLGYVNFPDVRLGTSICYDLRFPVMFSLMASKCFGVICIANWPQSRVNHWRALLIARAIENQMIMIGVNRVGVDGNGLFYEKSSMVVLPNGDISLPISSSDELDIYDVDFAVTTKARQEFPTVRDGNFERYQELYFNQQ